MERALILLCALALNAALAGPRSWIEAAGLLHLARLPAHLLRQLERKLDRTHRSQAERKRRGLWLALMVMLASLAAGSLLAWLCSYSSLRFAEMAIVALALPVRPLWDLAAQMRKKLYANDLAAARQLLAGTSWWHYAALDAHGLARATIEILAVGFSERIAAPALWYLGLGLPGLFMSKSVWLMRETLLRPGAPVSTGFGEAIALIHDALHYIPSRLTSLLWIVAALFFPAVKLADVAKPITADMLRASPQRMALIEAATLLHLGLGGPASLYAEGQWIGGGSARPSPGDIKHALILFALLHLLLFILIGANL